MILKGRRGNASIDNVFDDRSNIIATTWALLLGKPIQVHKISGKGLALFLLVSAELRWYFEKLKGKDLVHAGFLKICSQIELCQGVVNFSWKIMKWNSPEKPQCKYSVQGLHFLIDSSHTAGNDHFPTMVGNMISLQILVPSYTHGRLGIPCYIPQKLENHGSQRP